MQELSLHILDIVQNSIEAGATDIQLSVGVDNSNHKLMVSISDNGRGMNAEMLAMASDPFFTSRTTRDVGLGIPLLKQQAEQTGGDAQVISSPREGTLIHACFYTNHIDCAPLGDMASTVASVIQSNPQINLFYSIQNGQDAFTLNTAELRNILQGVPFSEPKVAVFIQEYIHEKSYSIQNRG